MNDRSIASSQSPEAKESPWIVGLDLGERSRGALAFAHWLGQGSEPTVGAYVLETWMRPYVEADVMAAVRASVASAAAKLHVSPPARITMVEATTAEEGLARVAEGAAGLVLGRATCAGEALLIRLGHVARRLLRALPGPVVVVPRDLTEVSDGPVLLATDLGETTTTALAFARRLAARHGLPLELVHVGEPRNRDRIDEFDPDWRATREAFRAAVERAYDAWVNEHHLGGARRHVAYGDPAARIAEIAAAQGAALVVVGSRRLGLAGRFFLSSTASALAGAASCPVAVVPPA